MPNLEYFDRRSGKSIDFYIAGFRRGWPGLEADDRISRIGKYEPHTEPKLDWIFSATKFNEFREDFTQRTSWTYSGSVDLILANARFDPIQQSAKIDFNSAVSLNLDKAKHDGLMLTVEMFFERVFHYAESHKGNDPHLGI